MSIIKKAIFLVISLALLFLSSEILAISYTLTVDNLPQSINANSEEDRELNVSLQFAANSVFYLRASFSHPESESKYFGYTNGYNGTEAEQFFKITTDENGEWIGSLKVKPDSQSQNFKGEGEYIFKIGYYTAAGNGPSWKYEGKVFLSYTPPIPTLTPTPKPSATPEPATNTPTSIPPTSTSTPKPTVAKEVVTSSDEGQVLALSDEGEVGSTGDEAQAIKDLYQPPEKKKSFLFPAVLIVGGIGLVSFSVYSFLKKEEGEESDESL